MEDIHISKEFIEKELPSAPPLYVSVYLMTKAVREASAAEIAARLDILESDVRRAWRYWEEREPVAQEKSARAEPAQRLFVEQRPDYSPAELAEYMKHREMKALLQAAQRKLAKPLSQQDISMIFGFYDWLGLPPDVIEMLLSYAVADGHKGMRYIEKIAMNWAEVGIDTVEKAAEYIEMRKTGYRAIMRAFGQSGRMPVEGEETFMRKWLTEYALPMDVIQLACERTVMQTGKVSFPYADGILKRWKDAGVKEMADVEMLDRAFAAKKAISPALAAKTPPAETKTKQNRFINYTQRQWDFAELEKLQREQRDKW